MIPADLLELARRASIEELPALIGVLEQAKAAAWARLTLAQHAGPEPSSSGQDVDRNLSVQEAAARLGVSREWLYRQAPKLPYAVRVGRRVLFSARGLDRWNRQRMGTVAGKSTP